jgi:hypothetical protein
MLCIHVFYHIYMNNFLLKPHFKIHNFHVKNIFEPNVFKWVIKNNFINSNLFSLLIINVKNPFQFSKGIMHIWFLKKDVWKKHKLSIFEVSMLWTCNFFLFVSSFENVNFAINKIYFNKNYDNLNYYASIVIFQIYKNVVLRNVHSLGWLLGLWFYPTIIHYHVDTYNYHCWHTHHKWKNPP